MELVREEYFENLAMRSFFQDFERDGEDNEIKNCKMYDILHDFAQCLAKNECLTVEIDGLSVPNQWEFVSHKARHSMIRLPTDPLFLFSVSNETKLQSLLIECYFDYLFIGNILSKLYDKLMCFKVKKHRRHNPEKSGIINSNQSPASIFFLMFLFKMNLEASATSTSINL